MLYNFNFYYDPFIKMNNLPLIEFSILIITISGLSAIPVFGLTGFHIGLVAMGRTTNEQVSSFTLNLLSSFY